ncbi:leucine zipper domain-containing protein [Cryobacterium sp. Y50]|uniref:integrase core domain-containing protein n=1 Tax=Cryobacterium sp. Y50 TaxID=2048286 RepID=UPI000CE33EBC|nr:leucine zipper domain-containing protein [Cryobacterium sp. Y50]
MSHINARLNVRGRALLVERFLGGRPAAHVAKELGISRQCAYRWVRRYRAEGVADLSDRSSRLHVMPTQTSPARIAADTGVPARAVSRVLARHHVPALWECDPLTGEKIRATRATANRYERARPGEMVHIDVKKLGRIPDGGGWRAQPGQTRTNHTAGHVRVGYDYVHAVIDDRTRLAYAEVHPDEKGVTAAGVLLRAAAFFASCGIPTIERVLFDNACAYRKSRAFKDAVTTLGAQQRFIKPHCPWTNGKVERFNRTLQAEWAYRQVFTNSTERTHALDPWLKCYNTERIHTGIGSTPLQRVSPT